ncbi:TonB-dependent receptor domain-containing protein [Salegentibacter chungangensis]|uniref:TonB-dependent receptor domain-containing protein n=1 Tax=Salegentibacter chungangensis TaxID=1335724 RepID=A0ABW3NRA3_9FLAO
MKQLFLIFIFLSSAISMANTEPVGKISGVVIDKDLQEPVPYATIIINDLDGNLVSGNTSQEDGTFIIEKIPAGEYIFKVQFIGYKTFSKKISINRRSSKVEIGTVALEPDISMLDDVTVVAERSTIEQRVDRKVINVGKDLTTSGATASDIMGNMPTLNVDQDGNISMRGNSNVRILVDGKPTNIPAAQLLKQIPSSSIKSVELITNPSAKYNPEGMSGIINIILHKNSNLGFNGNLDGGVTFGKKTRTNTSLNMNYRTGKFNFYTNLGINTGKRPQTGLIYTAENNSYEDIFYESENTSGLYKLGVDFYLNDKNTFSFYTNQNKSDGTPEGWVELSYLDNPDNNIKQFFFIDNDRLTSTYNFDYKRDFEKEGHNIELEVDYSVSDDKENTNFEFTGPGATYPDYKDVVRDDIKNTTINLDYINPLSEKTKLELGAEARVRDSENRFQTSNVNTTNSVYNYDNSIYSAYATFGQNFEIWSYKLGARLEQYDVEAILNSEKVYEDDYLTLYPSAFFSYNLAEKKTLQLSYSRRVDRPSLNQVNPVREFSTPRITGQGNPELDPQFTNSVELNYTQSFEKGNITAGTFYRAINNEINQTILEDPNDPSRLLLTFMNGDDNSSYGVEVSGSYKPFKWWSINSSAEFYSQSSRGVIGDIEREVETNVFSARMSNSFKATEDLTFQLFGFYRSPFQDIQFKGKEMYFVNAGARYNFLDNKATLSLNVNDIFDTQRFAFESELPLHQTGSFKPDSQTVFLGFSYRFGGGKNSALKRKNRDDREKSGGGIF